MQLDTFDKEVIGIFVGLLAATTLLQWKFNPMDSLTKNSDFSRFQSRYLTVFFLATMADWLTGPYLFRLLQERGYLHEQISALYICGYASSMIFGPALGGLADRYGRRQMCITFCWIYSLSCMLKLFTNFYALMMARFLSGIATSLLLSTFESWMIAQHNREGFPSEWLPRTFALATFGNGVVACLAGVVANIVADCCGHHRTYADNALSSLWFNCISLLSRSADGNHPDAACCKRLFFPISVSPKFPAAVNPFMLAVLLLVVAATTIKATWEEQKVTDLVERSNGQCTTSFRHLVRNRSVWLLGAVQACFESAMYTFVYLWTPSLDPDPEHHPPLGFIFAGFMLAIMIGSTIFRLLVQRETPIMETLRYSIMLGGGSLLLASLTTHRHVLLILFFAFECACGMFFPAMATMRGELVPEAHRAGIMNWFRVPLNTIVIMYLFLVGTISHSTLFFACALLCGLAYVCHRNLSVSMARARQASSESTHVETTPTQQGASA
eukprot:TRINITY_DN9366_c0_g1_i2.p1 TRINITY_DN9366_c0_g1~~TRINITY_DN9366_c0_g1_i2.p1  ORF type:complete len:498 (+),score=67.35 TRINITY_DN9366_c0_g1_i2:122-1615(+)